MWKNEVPFNVGATSRAPRARRKAAAASRAVKVGAAGLCALAAAGSVWGVGSMLNATPVFEVQTAQAQSSSDSSSASQEEQTSQKQQVVVYVSGAVANPGVYSLEEGSRVNDAVALAGGLAEDADCSTVNLARVVSDGEQIPIPTQDQVQEASAGSGTSTASSLAGSAAGLVNINTADEATLQTLSGVGPSTAAAIVAERQKNGAFATVEDLARVEGIGEKKFAKLKDSICV